MVFTAILIQNDYDGETVTEWADMNYFDTDASNNTMVYHRTMIAVLVGLVNHWIYVAIKDVDKVVVHLLKLWTEQKVLTNTQSVQIFLGHTS